MKILIHVVHNQGARVFNFNHPAQSGARFQIAKPEIRPSGATMCELPFWGGLLTLIKSEANPRICGLYPN